MAEFSQDELQAIATAFQELNVKPKADSATDFKEWMKDYVANLNDGGDANVKIEPGMVDAKPEVAKPETDMPAAASKIMTHHIPKLSCFSGDGSKSDTSYDLWRYEVDCLIKEKYRKETIAQSIRRSLRGDAGKVAMRLGPEADVQETIDKMESVFGTVERGETILEEFYSASQKKDEDSMAWSC